MRMPTADENVQAMREMRDSDAVYQRRQVICSTWRACCCSRADDGHCWGCGRQKGEHAEGWVCPVGKRVDAAVVSRCERCPVPTFTFTPNDPPCTCGSGPAKSC